MVLSAAGLTAPIFEAIHWDPAASAHSSWGSLAWPPNCTPADIDSHGGPGQAPDLNLILAGKDNDTQGHKTWEGGAAEGRRGRDRSHTPQEQKPRNSGKSWPAGEGGGELAQRQCRTFLSPFHESWPLTAAHCGLLSPCWLHCQYFWITCLTHGQ